MKMVFIGDWRAQRASILVQRTFPMVRVNYYRMDNFCEKEFKLMLRRSVRMQGKSPLLIMTFTHLEESFQSRFDLNECLPLLHMRNMGKPEDLARKIFQTALKEIGGKSNIHLQFVVPNSVQMDKYNLVNKRVGARIYQRSPNPIKFRSTTIFSMKEEKLYWENFWKSFRNEMGILWTPDHIINIHTITQTPLKHLELYTGSEKQYFCPVMRLKHKRPRFWMSLNGMHPKDVSIKEVLGLGILSFARYEENFNKPLHPELVSRLVASDFLPHLNKGNLTIDLTKYPPTFNLHDTQESIQVASRNTETTERLQHEAIANLRRYNQNVPSDLCSLIISPSIERDNQMFKHLYQDIYRGVIQGFNATNKDHIEYLQDLERSWKLQSLSLHKFYELCPESRVFIIKKLPPTILSEPTDLPTTSTNHNITKPITNDQIRTNSDFPNQINLNPSKANTFALKQRLNMSVRPKVKIALPHSVKPLITFRKYTNTASQYPDKTTKTCKGNVTAVNTPSFPTIQTPNLISPPELIEIDILHKVQDTPLLSYPDTRDNNTPVVEEELPGSRLPRVFPIKPPEKSAIPTGTELTKVEYQKGPTPKVLRKKEHLNELLDKRPTLPQSVPLTFPTLLKLVEGSSKRIRPYPHLCLPNKKAKLERKPLLHNPDTPPKIEWECLPQEKRKLASRDPRNDPTVEEMGFDGGNNSDVRKRAEAIRARWDEERECTYRSIRGSTTPPSTSEAENLMAKVNARFERGNDFLTNPEDHNSPTLSTLPQPIVPLMALNQVICDTELTKEQIVQSALNWEKSYLEKNWSPNEIIL